MIASYLAFWAAQAGAGGDWVIPAGTTEIYDTLAGPGVGLADLSSPDAHVLLPQI